MLLNKHVRTKPCFVMSIFTCKSLLRSTVILIFDAFPYFIFTLSSCLFPRAMFLFFQIRSSLVRIRFLSNPGTDNVYFFFNFVISLFTILLYTLETYRVMSGRESCRFAMECNWKTEGISSISSTYD